MNLDLSRFETHRAEGAVWTRMSNFGVTAVVVGKPRVSRLLARSGQSFPPTIVELRLESMFRETYQEPWF